MTDSPKETEYFLRFISMYIDICTEVVYRVFVHVIHNKDTASFFQSNCKLFHDLEKRKVLSKAEIPFVVSSSPRPESFDLSLLIKILCNSKTTLTPPLNGWDHQPGPSDLSIAADLLRLRKIRNITVGHRNRAKLPKYKFDRLWEGVECILLRLANATDPGSKEGLRKKIEHYRKRPLQIQDEKTTFYLSKLQEWWQTCEDVSGLKNKVEDLLQRTQEIALYFKTKPQHYCRYIRLLFDGGRSVLSGILKKELSSIGLDLQAVLLEKASQLETNFINKEMYSQVFPQQTNLKPDYDSWDILTLTTVIMHAFRNSLSENVVEEIKIIDNALRNYAQTAFESLDSTTFQFCCEDLVSSVKALSNYVGGETKTNCKMLIEEYRKLDDADVDVDNYLNQMTRYASEIKTIPAIYKKTIADLKKCATQMIEGGVDFEREKAMEMKMVVTGKNKEKENRAEEILETVCESALEMSESPEKFSSVRHEVDKFLEEVRKIPSVQTTKVARHCILLTITYSSWEALLKILNYMESRNLREHFENISRELEYFCGEMVVLSGNVTVESIQSAMNTLDEHAQSKDSSIQIGFSCFSVESIGKLFSLFHSDNTRQIFRNLDGALSECVGDEIHVHATTDMKGFCDLFDSQEVLTTEGNTEAAIGYQPSGPDDPLQKVPFTEQTSEADSSFQPSEAEDPLQKEVPSIKRTSGATIGLQPSKSNYLIRKNRITIENVQSDIAKTTTADREYISELTARVKQLEDKNKKLKKKNASLSKVNMDLRKDRNDGMLEKKRQIQKIDELRTIDKMFMQNLEEMKRIIENRSDSRPSFTKLEYIQPEETEHANETTNMEHREKDSNLKSNKATSGHIGKTVTDIDKPLNIGAEDMLRFAKYTYFGDLHFLDVGLLRNKWKHRYCIIFLDWLYIYSRKTSKNRKLAFSLKEFASARVCEPEKGMRFCISIELKGAQPPLLFACDTDERRQEWLMHFCSEKHHLQSHMYKVSADSGFESAEACLKHIAKPEQVEEDYADIKDVTYITPIYSPDNGARVNRSDTENLDTSQSESDSDYSLSESEWLFSTSFEELIFVWSKSPEL